MSLTYREDNNTGFIEFDQKDSKVNLLTAAALQELDKILDSLAPAGSLPAGKSSLNAVVIVSKKKDIFIAGADIREIEGITQTEEGAQKSKAGQDILNKLEDLAVPTVAMIDGVALGGGCELALACQYRLATFNEKVRIGLPEVNLGIFPAFGGTYRLPRLIGLPQALTLILTGKPVDGEKALRLGLVDRLVTSKNLEHHLHQFIADIRQGKIITNKYARRKPKGFAGFLETSLIGQGLTFRQSRQNVLKATKGFYPAPLKAINVVKKNFYVNRAKGLDREARSFGELAVTTISKNLIHVFYLSEQYRKLSVDGVPPKPIEKCGVLGAGVMGGGIAQLLSYSDIWVRLKDINYAALAIGLKSAAKLYQEAVKKRRLKPYAATVKMDKITPTLDYSGFATTDIVIEAVVENMDVKRKVFRELSAAVGPRTILATNTSALSVTEMAKEVRGPTKVIGLHFFNPVHKMPLVEIITTPQTSPETLATTLAFAKRLGKTPIIVKDSCGFLVNRILLGYINEAGRLLEEGHSIVDIDRVMTDFGMPMGPFALTDEVGLDVGRKVLHILAEGLGERFKPAEIFEKVHAQGFLGKKSGKGFYLPVGQAGLHQGKGRCVPNPGITTKGRTPLEREEGLRRMVYLMVNEAARCLEEKIVDGPGAVDVGMVFGTGFPAFRGGLLRYADTVGVPQIVDELNRLRDKFRAERFEPAAYLLRLRDEKKKFYSCLVKSMGYGNDARIV